MKVERIVCDICGNNAFHIFKIDDNGIYSKNEHICTRCGAHYNVDEISQKYTVFWNEFISKLNRAEDIESTE